MAPQHTAFDQQQTAPSGFQSLAEVLGVDLERIDRLGALAWRLYQERQHKEAAAVFRGLISLDPENIDLYRGYAITAARTGELAEAIEYSERALFFLDGRADRNADRAQFYALLASFYYKAGRKVRAVDHAERCVALSPPDAPWLAKVRRGLERARASVEKAKKKHVPLSDTLAPRLAKVLNEDRSLAWALGYQDDELIKLFQNGSELLENGQPKRAKRIFAGLVALDDSVPIFHVALASAYQALQRKNAARTHYNKAVARAERVHKGSDILADVLLRRSRFFAATDRFVAARADVDRVLALDNADLPRSLRKRAAALRDNLRERTER